MDGKKTTIQLSEATREKVKAIGKKGESYETIILKLLKNGGEKDEQM